MTPEVNPLSKIDDEIAWGRKLNEQMGTQEPPRNYADLFQKPPVGAAQATVNKYTDAFDKALRPYARAPEAARAFGEQYARQALANEQAYQALQSMIGRISLKTPEGLQIADDMQSGKSQLPVARVLRNLFDKTWQEVVELRPDAASRYRKNYFSQLWKNPEQAQVTLERLGGGGRRLGGKGGFLYTQNVPSILEGMKNGLEPISD